MKRRYKRRIDPAHSWGVVAVGTAGLVAVPTILATLHATEPHLRWWWPTNWMAVPAAIFLIGVVLVVLPLRGSAPETHSTAGGDADRISLPRVSSNSDPDEPHEPSRPHETTPALPTGHVVGNMHPLRAEPARHAFIAYTHADSAKVDKLQQILEAAGIPVWRDTSDLWPGEDWRIKIRHAITDGAIAFIACFSRASLAREKSYQNEELMLAIDQLRLRPPGNPWLIPLRFDDCEIPDLDIGGGRTLASLQRADLSGEDFTVGAERLVTSVLRIIGKLALPESAAGLATVSPSRSGTVVLSPEAMSDLNNIDPQVRPRILRELDRISRGGSDVLRLRGREGETPYLLARSADYRIIFRHAIPVGSADSEEILIARIIRRDTAEAGYGSVLLP